MRHTELSLGMILKTVYENAPSNEKSLMIRLFGIKFGRTIKDNRLSIPTIIKYSGLSPSYQAEVNKGIGLSKYVQMKPDKDIFEDISID